MRTLWSLLVTVVLTTIVAPSALATLGGAAMNTTPETSVSAAAMTSTLKLNAYQTILPSGTVIKEYVNANNIVVAVTWNGPILPDFRQLFGTYFDQYVTNAQTTPSRLRHILVTTNALVVVSHGHFKAFQGMAYLPELVPAGFVFNE